MRLPHRPSRFALPILGFALAGLSGCLFETRVTGGAEDFPNTVALGAAASENLNAHADWDQFSHIPAIDFKDADSLVMAPPARSGAPAQATWPGPTGVAGVLPKPSASSKANGGGAAPDTAFDLSDTATLGIGRRYIRDEGPLRVRTDTLIFRWDAAARDAARDGGLDSVLLLENRGAEDWKLTLRLTGYRYVNLDSAGGFDRAAFHERLPKAGGILLHKLFVVRPGPDGDFAAKADNRPVHFATARTRGPDTLDAFTVSDADGDGELWGDNDSGLVEVRSLQSDPILRPAVARFTQAMRAVLFKQEGRTYPVSFRETRTDRNGREVVFSVRGPRADSAFGPGDTVTVTVHATAGPDELARFTERTARYRIRLSPTPGRFGSNALVEYTVEARWREGAFRRGMIVSSRIIITPEEPLASGELILDGAIAIEAEFADGATGSATGTIKDKHIEADLTELKAGVKLRRLRVRWDAAADGKVLSEEHLPD